VCDMYRDSRENLLEILAGVIILSPISSVRGHYPKMCGEGKREIEQAREGRWFVCAHTYSYVRHDLFIYQT